MPANKSSFTPVKLKEGHNLGVVSEILEQPAQAPAKIGRPKGKPKTKKTFYLTDGAAAIQEIKLTLAKDHSLLFKDESELADLAVAFLLRTIRNPDRVQEVIRLYNLEIKEQ